MASAPNNLPIFYKDLMPLNVRDHEKWTARQSPTADWLIGQHAVPLTVDEFGLAQRYYPIVFSSGENSVPLALFGLNEGVNVYVDDKGVLETDSLYIPAYARRYPFILARIDPNNADSMTLCFDPTAGLLGEFKDGEALFEAGGEPTEHTKGMLKFCEDFEGAGMRTQAFMDEMKKNDLLIEGEVAISQDGLEQPFVYRGFQLLNREKFNELRGDLLRTWNQNGILAIAHAHFFSLDLMRNIFARQTYQGKGPGGEAMKAKAEAEKAAKKTKK